MAVDKSSRARSCAPREEREGLGHGWTSFRNGDAPLSDVESASNACYASPVAIKSPPRDMSLGSVLLAEAKRPTLVEGGPMRLRGYACLNACDGTTRVRLSRR